ncbi:MAG: MFS transporter [Nanobdellota archaeon]
MLFKKDEFKLLSPFYAYYFIISFSMMILPFMVIYFRNLQFSFFHISILLATFSLSSFLFEIPTGAFADSYSRKYSVILGFFLVGLCASAIFFATSFWLLLVLFLLIGFGMTFVSGAENAWVMDNLEILNRTDLRTEFFMKSQIIGAFGGIFAPLIGSLIVKNSSIQPLWLIWGGGFLLGAFILFFFGKELYVPKRTSFVNSLSTVFSTSKQGFRFTIKNKIVLFTILVSIFITMMTSSYDFWQPFLEELNMSVFMLGIVFSVLSAVEMLFLFLTRYLEKFGVKRSLALIIFFRVALYCGVLFLVPGMYLIGAFIFILGSSVLSLRFPLIDSYFQKHLSKKYRATVSSIKSMGVQLGLVISTLLVGVFADVFSVRIAIVLSSVFGLIGLFFLRKLK